MVRSSLDARKDAYQEQSPEERALARLEHQRIEIITNEAITAGRGRLAGERIGRDGRLTPNEAALVAYLKQESPTSIPTCRRDRPARASRLSRPPEATNRALRRRFALR